MLSLLVLVCCVSALAETTTEYSLSDIPGKLSLSDSYIVLTPENLNERTDVLSARNLDPESAKTDWQARHVVLQAWVPEMDACLEVRVFQDADSAAYYDLDKQTTQARTAYRTSHLKGTAYSDLGYTIQSAEWKRQTRGGRFLRLKYKRVVDTLVIQGYAAKTIRNGWTLVLDYQVYNRKTRAKDQNSLNKVANTVEFGDPQPGATIPTVSAPTTDAVPASEASPVVGGLLQFTSVPPQETNTGAFTVEGTCAGSAHLIGVVMRYASPTPTRIEADATKAGKFKMKVQLPTEGIWLMTLTVEKNGAVIAEKVFDTTIYQANLLPVSLAEEVPEQFETNEFVLTGTTSKGVTVQCVVTGGAKPFDKTIRTNGTGKFTFKIPTSSQSQYDVTLILQKKGYDTRRLTWAANRRLTAEDLQEETRNKAVKPAYSTLSSRLEAYTGKVMGYKTYITDIQQVGDEWLIYAALTKTDRGTLKNVIVVSTSEQPTIAVGEEWKMYGTCTGAYEVQSEEGTVSYPRFDLLFWDPVK